VVSSFYHLFRFPTETEEKHVPTFLGFWTTSLGRVCAKTSQFYFQFCNYCHHRPSSATPISVRHKIFAIWLTWPRFNGCHRDDRLKIWLQYLTAGNHDFYKRKGMRFDVFCIIFLWMVKTCETAPKRKVTFLKFEKKRPQNVKRSLCYVGTILEITTPFSPLINIMRRYYSQTVLFWPMYNSVIHNSSLQKTHKFKTLQRYNMMYLQHDGVCGCRQNDVTVTPCRPRPRSKAAHLWDPAPLQLIGGVDVINYNYYNVKNDLGLGHEYTPWLRLGDTRTWCRGRGALGEWVEFNTPPDTILVISEAKKGLRSVSWLAEWANQCTVPEFVFVSFLFMLLTIVCDSQELDMGPFFANAIQSNLDVHNLRKIHFINDDSHLKN